jgi:hypothetical protein
MTDRSIAQDLAKESIKRGDPTGWFEQLYHLADTSHDVVPWADKKPNPHLIRWAEKKNVVGNGLRALVIGSGYGDDAEWLASRNFDVTAFDISETAISTARRRFPKSPVHYQVADALNLPDEWRRTFDLVFEAYTLQVLQGKFRKLAGRMIASTVKGTLLIVSRGREEIDEKGSMPWPLTRHDLLHIQQDQTDLSLV